MKTQRKYDVPMYTTLTDLNNYTKLLMRDYPHKSDQIHETYHEYLDDIEVGVHPDDAILDCLADLHHMLNIRKRK